MNAVVGQILRCIIHEQKSGNWDSLLPTVELAINSQPNSSTGGSPFFLNYGYHLVLPVELLKGDEEVNVEAVDNFIVRIQMIGSKHVEIYYNQSKDSSSTIIRDIEQWSTRLEICYYCQAEI